MKQKKLEELTDEELLQLANKMKSTSIMNAVLIGFMIGIIIWSIANSTVGLLTLIPLFFIYKLINKSNSNKELKEQLQKRNLK